MHIPFLKPPFGEEEINAVKVVMQTAELTNGIKVREFERMFARLIGVNYAIAVNSGTSALELILKALVLSDTYDLKQGDQVLIPSFTYAAVANAVVNAGLRPVFADIVPDFTINPYVLDGIKDIKAIVAVHTFGLPCMMNELMALAEENDIIVIEDCAEACGAIYHGKKVGSFGVASAFSFTPTKNMTTGEGGMITTDSMLLADMLRTLRDNGILKPLGQDTYRDVITPGHNYKMSEITAAIGIEQLKKLDDNNYKRYELAKKFNDALCDLPIHRPQIYNRDVHGHVFQLYTIQLKINSMQFREQVVHDLRKHGVSAQVYFNPPLHRTHAYKQYPCHDFMHNTEKAANTVIQLPFYPQLTDEEIEYMADTLKKILGGG